LAVLPNCGFVAGGIFTTAGGVTANRIACWNGSSWSAFGSGMNSDVRALAVLPNGDLVAGGVFTTAGGVQANHIARFSFGGTAPSITTQPVAASACLDGAASFFIAVSGTCPLTYRWQVQRTDGAWTALGNDPAPISCSDGGVGFVFATPIDSPTVSIGIRGCPGVQHWPIRCIVTNSCGSTTSDIATLTICPADFNCDGALTSQDFFDFLSAFFAQTPTADFNHDGAVNSQDFFDFLATLFVGCS
jgi:hypothetical protein